MGSWIKRIGLLFGRVSGPVAGAPAPIASAPGASIVEPAAQTLPPVETDIRLPLFCWLVGTPSPLDAAMAVDEQRLLLRLDAKLADEAALATLLPRAPSVVPRLMSSLRDDSQSIRALSEQVAKDPLLVAEVTRLANSVLHASHDPVRDLAQAIARLGTAGLRRAIARVVLRPIFDSRADTLTGRSAARLWLHSESKAAECMRLAATAGLDPFEGYLAGLMHNIGWSAGLRAIDQCLGGVVPAHFSHAFVLAFERRRDLFFASIVAPWQITEALTALALESLAGGLGATRSALGQTLQRADRHASMAMLGFIDPAPRSTST